MDSTSPGSFDPETDAEALRGGAEAWNVYVRRRRMSDVRWRATLANEDFSGADLSNADLIYADLSGAQLMGATLRNAELREADLSHADLAGANLTEADLTSAHLNKAELTRAVLTRAELTDADLTDATARHAKLHQARLPGALLVRADLTSADLTSADLTQANLRSANLIGAKLRMAHLGEADLTDVDLTKADLIGADLNGAKLDSPTPTWISENQGFRDSLLQRDSGDSRREKFIQAMEHERARSAFEGPHEMPIEPSDPVLRLSIDMEPGVPVQEVAAITAAVASLCLLASRVGIRPTPGNATPDGSILIATGSDSDSDFLVRRMRYGSPLIVEILESAGPILGAIGGTVVARDMLRGTDSKLLGLFLTLCRPEERRAFLEGRVEAYRANTAEHSARREEAGYKAAFYSQSAFSVARKSTSSIAAAVEIVSDEIDTSSRLEVIDELPALEPVLSRNMRLELIHPYSDFPDDPDEGSVDISEG